jgi:Glycosyltransferase like family 2
MNYSCLDTPKVNLCALAQKDYQPLIQTRPLLQCEVCVIVPVRNEAELLEGCLNALAYQIDFQGQTLDFKRYEVILFINNCTDDSAAIAHHFSRQHPELRLHIIERMLPPAEAYIGRVRQMLMDEAYHRLAWLGLAGLSTKRGVIASTDGDTRVSPNWIAATLLELAQGVDAVGGRIVADSVSCEALDPQVRMRYLRGDYYHQLMVELEAYLDRNPHDCWPRHAQHYGASLAVTAQTYQKAGGMPAVRTLEDVAFYRALLRVGARFRHSPLVQVTTSARQTVRTIGGFATQLNEWAAIGQQQRVFLVESAHAMETRFQTRRQLRDLWRRILNGYQHTAKDVGAYANTLGICAQWLWEELTQPHSFELLFERVEARQQQDGIWQRRWPLVNLEEAIADLNLRLQKLRPQQQLSESKFLHPALLPSIEFYGESYHDYCNK